MHNILLRSASTLSWLVMGVVTRRILLVYLMPSATFDDRCCMAVKSRATYLEAARFAHIKRRARCECTSQNWKMFAYIGWIMNLGASNLVSVRQVSPTVSTFLVLACWEVFSSRTGAWAFGWSNTYHQRVTESSSTALQRKVCAGNNASPPSSPILLRYSCVSYFVLSEHYTQRKGA